jgi:hypothetical protein
MKKIVSRLFFVLALLTVCVNVFASSDTEIANVMVYIKWVIGIVAGIVTASAVGFFLWGWHLKNQGDPKGPEMIKNAIWTLVMAAVAWSVLGALVMKGAELNTGVNNITKGWQ